MWEVPGAPAVFMNIATAAGHLPAPEGKALRLAAASQPMGDDAPPTPAQVVACVAGAGAELVGPAEVDGYGTCAFYLITLPAEP